MNKLCVFLVLIFCLREISGVIYHLNDTEYEKLPQLFELDNYESCKEEPDSIYCVANLELYTDSPNEIYTLAKEYSAFYSRHYNYLRPDKGVCVTKKCKSYAENTGLDIHRDLESVLEGCLNETINNKYNLSAKLINMHCQEETHVDTLDWVFLVIVLILVLLNVIGSCYDSFLNKNKEDANHKIGQKILLTFSVFQNMKILKADQSDPNNKVLKDLVGLKLIACVMVVLGHSLITINAAFTADPHTSEKTLGSKVLQTLVSNTNGVQIFFLISGLVLTYTRQRYSVRSNLTWKSLPMIVFQRWWRLTPSAAVVIGFVATWMRHVSNGPLWRFYVTNGPFVQCRQFFWAHMFYFNNYLVENQMCAIHTWYIAADFQMFILGLIVHFFITNRSLKFKMTILGLLALIGSCINVMHVWIQDLDAFTIMRPELGRSTSDPTLQNLHMKGHNNITCFMIGMANGYIIHQLQQKNWDWSKFKIGQFYNCLLIPLCQVIAYYGTFVYREGERASMFARTTYAGLSKWAIGIIFAAWSIGNVCKCNAFSRFFMGNYSCMILSKLSYGVYLVHMIFICIIMGARTQLTPVSYISCFFTYIQVLVLSFMVALPLYLCVEVPAYNIIKILLNKEVKKKSS